MEDRDRLVSQLIDVWFRHLQDHYGWQWGAYRLATDEVYLELGFSEDEVADGDVPLVFQHDDGTTIEVELEAFAHPISKQIREERLARLQAMASREAQGPPLAIFRRYNNRVQGGP